LLGGVAEGITFDPARAAYSTGNWPARPMRLISTFAAGGSSDISLRILAEYFEGRMGQKFFVENRPGAGSTIANQAAARADPDGYTFLYAAVPYETAEAMFGKLSYDPHRDLRPIAMAMLVPLFLIVNASAPYKPFRSSSPMRNQGRMVSRSRRRRPVLNPIWQPNFSPGRRGSRASRFNSEAMRHPISNFWPACRRDHHRAPCRLAPYQDRRAACAGMFFRCAQLGLS
jgi:hypothetical protein